METECVGGDLLYPPTHPLSSYVSPTLAVVGEAVVNTELPPCLLGTYTILSGLLSPLLSATVVGGFTARSHGVQAFPFLSILVLLGMAILSGVRMRFRCGLDLLGIASEHLLCSFTP